ncbi:MAG: hypothetical protein MUF00_12850 [Gemmatimonadaceae bacterium]|nr:hypothetical protein [Gemmatimonadaceae bacterium]
MLPLLVAGVAPLGAQGMRIRGTTTSRLLELRPFVSDSVLASTITDTSGGTQYRLAPNGLTVKCIEGETWCRYRRSSERRESAVPVFQDLDITAWGLGQGISAHAELRGRTAFGSDRDLWPRALDRFDVLAAYLEVAREKGQARLGRQWLTSGLGFYNFDGASVELRPWRRLSLNAWGGVSLARGLNELRTSGEIAGIDEFPPEQDAYLLGAELRVRPTARSTASVMYQRELMRNRGGLFSERLAADGTLRTGRVQWEAAVEHDLAQQNLNNARLQLRLPTMRGVQVAVEGRRFRPFFELWTIWGAFSPVGFNEASLISTWALPSRRLGGSLRGSWRQWDETNAGLQSTSLRDRGWRVAGDAAWRTSGALTVHGGYAIDIGLGAARNDATFGARYDGGDRWSAGLTGSMFQSIYEYRLGTGRVYGTSFDGALRLTRDVRLVGDFTVYQQSFTNRAPQTDWSQRRGTLRLEWTAGMGGADGADR